MAENDAAPIVRIPPSRPESTPPIYQADRSSGALDPRAAGGRPEARVGVSTDKIFSFQRDLIRFRLIKP
ncbi:hypothetical protein, partial [Methanocrinis sp.]|uniref:hypothetical protein n=1 Tax=Methanocrinis sp. TaxID=3101522 RepID=UPI003D0B575E